MMIKKIGLSDIFQKFILKTKDKKFMEKLNRNLPICESLCATSLYIVANETNKDIPKERKASLNWQTIIGGLLGATASKGLDSWANKHKENICKELEKLNIKDSKKIITGTRIAVPLIITSIVTRYLMSTLSIPISIGIAHLQRKLKSKDNSNDK